MKQNFGFTRFEFFFVMAAIGLILLVGVQRYSKMINETKNSSFEIVSKHFSASAYNYHARWVTAQADVGKNAVLDIEQVKVTFSASGWPIAIGGDESGLVSLTSCMSLWNHFLQNAPTVSFEGGYSYRSRPYHLRVMGSVVCRFEFITDHPNEFYFDYAPFTGNFNSHSPQ
jgi:hypothetical protein